MRGLNRAGIGLVLLLGVLAPTCGVVAQGVDAFFAPPITMNELDEYAVIIGLSPEQRRAIDPMFESYQQAYAEIRKGDIARFVAEREKMRKERPQEYIEPANLREEVRRIRSMRARLAALDDSFFAGFERLLATAQTGGLVSSRLLRERQRYLARVGWRFDGLSAFDLAREIRSIALTPGERAAIAPFLRRYEEELTDALRVYEERTLDDWASPARGDEYIAQFIEQLRIGARVLAVHRRWLDQLTAGMAADHAAELRLGWRRAAYRGVAPDPEALEPAFARLLESQSLGDEQCADIAALRDGYLTDHGKLTDRIIALIDTAREDPLFWYQPKGRRPPVGVDTARELIERRSELNRATEDALASLIGVERAEESVASIERPLPDRRPMRLPRVRSKGFTISLGGSSLTSWGEGFRRVVGSVGYRPMTEDELERCIERLELDERQIELAKSLHDEYRQRFMERFKEGARKHGSDPSDCWTTDENGVYILPTPDHLRADQQSLRRWIGELQDLDAAFFTELEESVLTEEQGPLLPSLRSSRRRGGFLSRDGPLFFIFGTYPLDGASELFQLDLTTLLSGVAAPEDQAEEFALICEAYGASATALVDQRVDAVLDCGLLGNLLLIESFHDGEEEHEFSLAGDSELAARFRSACRRYSDSRKRYYRLNETTCQQLMELLPPGSAQVLERRFREAVYPRLLEDPEASHHKLTDAVELDGLTQEQLAAIYELRIDYEQRYRDVTDRLIASQRPPEKLGYYRINEAGEIESNPENEQAKQIEEQSTLRFERSELNVAVRRQLGEILTERQRRAIKLDRQGSPTTPAR